MDTKKKAMLASFFIIIVLAAGISLLYFRFQPVPEESQNQNPEHYITPAVGNTRNASYLRPARRSIELKCPRL